MKPCDCVDMVSIERLNEEGMGFNKEWYIKVHPLSVFISNRTTVLCIPMHRFTAFAEWYLTDQGEKELE